LPVTLLDTDYYLVERVDAQGFVRVTRRVRPFESELEVENACNPVQRVLDAEVRTRCSLLVDTRIVVGRNDPASETMFAKHRRAMIVGFVRVALLVRTPAGLLHVQRLLANDRADARAFANEDEAVAFVKARPRPGSGPPRAKGA
jgi:hypothetical protein